MAAISRTFASQLVNRSYVNVPASAGALKKAFSISSSSRDEETQAPTLASTKNRSSAGPLNRSFVNGKSFDGKESIQSYTACRATILIPLSHCLLLLS
jgi:ubiquinol-cytochrome c reductase iron-sulfur subunit